MTLNNKHAKWLVESMAERFSNEIIGFRESMDYHLEKGVSDIKLEMITTIKSIANELSGAISDIAEALVDKING
jgi:hypothetical protein